MWSVTVYLVPMILIANKGIPFWTNTWILGQDNVGGNCMIKLAIRKLLLNTQTSITFGNTGKGPRLNSLVVERNILRRVSMNRVCWKT
jgi:hypothetical protein